jgi:hypothetical protein
MNIYFELADSVVGPAGKYFAAYGIADNTVPLKYLELMRNSNRAWRENEDGVSLIKDRSANAIHSVVDAKEFMWVKLRSTTV